MRLPYPPVERRFIFAALFFETQENVFKKNLRVTDFIANFAVAKRKNIINHQKL